MSACADRRVRLGGLVLAGLLLLAPGAEARSCGWCYNNWDFWGWSKAPGFSELRICAGGTVTFRWRGEHGVFQVPDADTCPVAHEGAWAVGQQGSDTQVAAAAGAPNPGATAANLLVASTSEAPAPAPGSGDASAPSPPPLPLPPPASHNPGPAPNEVVQAGPDFGELSPVARGTHAPMFVWTVPSEATTLFATSQAGSDCQNGAMLRVDVISLDC